jgi:hypothetical protein
MLASLIFDAVLSIPAEQRKKPISVLCTDTRVEIPAIAEMIEGTLDRMRKCSQQNGLNIEANLLQNPNPWGGDNRPLYKLYASASNGECPIQIPSGASANIPVSCLQMC